MVKDTLPSFPSAFPQDHSSDGDHPIKASPLQAATSLVSSLLREVLAMMVRDDEGANALGMPPWND